MPRLRRRRTRVFNPETVTHVASEREVEPAQAGLSSTDVAAFHRALVAMYRTGNYPGISLCLRRRGVIVFDRAIGHARGNGLDDPPGTELVPATPDTLFNLFSASKLVTAMLVHLLDERRLIHLDDPVAEYIPGFGTRGKEAITIRHVLTHRAGIPVVGPEDARLDILTDPDRILEIMLRARPMTRPGRRFAYHALTGGFVLAELIRRVSGVDVQTFLRQEISDRLGLSHFRYGVEAEDVGKVALNTFAGPPLLPPATTIFRRAIGMPYRDAIRASNDRRFLTGIVPAGNIITTAEQACHFMEMLLRGGSVNGVQIYDPRTIARATAEEVFYEVDATTGVPIRYSMGFMLGNEWASAYGFGAPRAFGHMGFTNVIMWADPERDLSACLMCNGKPVLAPGTLRWLGLIYTIAHRCRRDWGRGGREARATRRSDGSSGSPS